MFMNVRTTNKNVHDARAKLLNFYNFLTIHFEFSIVNKTNFKEIQRRYRNDRKKIKIRDDKIFNEKFVSLKFVFKKKKIHKTKNSSKNDLSKLIKKSKVIKKFEAIKKFEVIKKHKIIKKFEAIKKHEIIKKFEVIKKSSNFIKKLSQFIEIQKLSSNTESSQFEKKSDIEEKQIENEK